MFLRMIFSGCEYAAESYLGWQAAAEMYPQISFIELDCLKDGNGLEVCNKYQAEAQGKSSNSGTASPFHVLFRAGETSPIEKAWCTVGSKGGDPSVYVNLISDYLKQGHVEFLKMLTSDSTDSFVKLSTYTVMVLADTSCQEDSTFLGAWATAVSQDLAPIPPSDISYGRLDCGLFPEECARWSDVVPAAVFHKQDNGKYKKLVVTSVSDLGVVVESAKSQLDAEASANLPPAAQVTPVNPEQPEGDYQVLQNTELQNRKLEDIKKLYKGYQAEWNGQKPAWEGTMNSLEKCDVGTSNKDDREQATINANIMRQLAGVDALALNDDKFLDGCQRTALVLHKIGYVTHYPNVDRTDVCIEGQKSVVAEYAEKSNLAQNCASATRSIGLFMEDLGEENAQALGHRRWILNPNVKEIGFGLAPQRSYPTGDKLGEININQARPSIVVMRITTPDDQPYTKVNFISWPSAGPFPTEQVPPIWHVSCNLFRDATISKDDVKIRVTREDQKNIPVKAHFFNRQYMGTPDALIMQMDDNVKDLCSTGHTVHVEIWVTSKKQKIDYSFTLFDLQKEEKVCLYADKAVSCPKEYTTKYGRGNYGNVAQAMTDAKRVVVHVGEPISGPIDWSTVDGHLFVTGQSITGKVTVGPSTVLEIANPENCEVVVKWDLPSKKAGQFITAGKPKSITVDVSSPVSLEESESQYTRVDVYNGQTMSVAFTCSDTIKDVVEVTYGYVFLGGYVNGSTVGVSASYMSHVLALRTGVCSSEPEDESYKRAIVIEDLKTDGLGKNMPPKKLVRWFICDNLNVNYGGTAKKYYIDSSIFPSDRYQDYEIVCATGQGGEAQDLLNFKYESSMEKTIRTIKFTQVVSPSQTQLNVEAADGTYIIRHPGFTINMQVYTGTNRNVYIPLLNAQSSDRTFAKELPSVTDTFKDGTGKDCYCDVTGSGSSCEFTAGGGNGCSQIYPAYLWYRMKTTGISSVSSLFYTDDSNGYGYPHQFFPESGKEATPVTLQVSEQYGQVFRMPYVDKNGLLHRVVVENYQDLTLDVNASGLRGITYYNVGKVTLKLGGKQSYEEIAVTEPGAWTSYLSSVDGIAIKSLKVTSDANVQANNVEATNLVTTNASCTLNGIKVTSKWDVTDSFVTLSGAHVESDLRFRRTSRFPRITIDDKTQFNPKSIEYDMGFSTSSSKLLELVTQTTTLVSGITSEQCKSLVDKVVLQNAPAFTAVCADDGSLQVTRTIDDGLYNDFGTLSPVEEVNEDKVWQPADVPNNIKVDKEVSLSVVGGLNFWIGRVEVGSSGKVTATNMEIRNELTLSGGASLKAAEGSKITIQDRQTVVNVAVKDGKAPSVDLGGIGEYSSVPAAIQVTVDESLKDDTTLVKGRKLNCEEWLKVIKTSGSKAGDVSFKCEKTGEAQAKLLADSMLEEWAVIMETKGGGLPGGAIAAIVIVVLLVIGAAIGLSIFFVRRRGKRIVMRKNSERVQSQVEP